MSMDGSPIFDKTDIAGLYLNCGWCYGGFKATPASGEAFAHLIAKDEPSDLIRPFRLDRYRKARFSTRRAWARRPICTRGGDADQMSLLR